jgi:hypothetical protein
MAVAGALVLNLPAQRSYATTAVLELYLKD